MATNIDEEKIISRETLKDKIKHVEISERH